MVHVSTQGDILAVIVLYRRSADQSQAFTSMRRLLAQDPGFSVAIELMLCDNSPCEQAAPADFDGAYLRNPWNPGLAHCYNQALERASRSGKAWLMLLDQDTTVTECYLRELLAEVPVLLEAHEVAAIVPRLIEGEVMCSPIHPPTLGPAQTVSEAISGIVPAEVHVFNSGAVLRVDAMNAIGGFPLDFPLDYLDHATFTSLQRRGGRVYLLRSVLAHELSSNTETPHDAAGDRRRILILEAERRFYILYGTRRERWLRRFRLFRAVAGRVLRRQPAAQSWQMLKAAARP